MSGNAECVSLVTVPNGPITPFSRDTERACASSVVWADSLELLTQSQESGKPSSSSCSLALTQLASLAFCSTLYGPSCVDGPIFHSDEEPCFPGWSEPHRARVPLQNELLSTHTPLICLVQHHGWHGCELLLNPFRAWMLWSDFWRKPGTLLPLFPGIKWTCTL